MALGWATASLGRSAFHSISWAMTEHHGLQAVLKIYFTERRRQIFFLG